MKCLAYWLEYNQYQINGIFVVIIIFIFIIVLKVQVNA